MGRDVSVTLFATEAFMPSLVFCGSDAPISVEKTKLHLLFLQCLPGSHGRSQGQTYSWFQFLDQCLQQEGQMWLEERDGFSFWAAQRNSVALLKDSLSLAGRISAGLDPLQFALVSLWGNWLVLR